METEDGLKEETTVDEETEQLLQEAYAEAEQEKKLNELRAEKSVEERQQEFKKMLLERGVSPCSSIVPYLHNYVHVHCTCIWYTVHV